MQKATVLLFLMFITFACTSTPENNKSKNQRAQEYQNVLGINIAQSEMLFKLEANSKKAYDSLVKKYKGTKDWPAQIKKYQKDTKEEFLSLLGAEKYAQWETYQLQQKFKREEEHRKKEIEKHKRTSPDEPYKPVWGSLWQHNVPKWAQDAKFGVYAHWGIYSQTGDWDYGKPNWGNYYITAYHGVYSTKENQEQRRMFEEKYGKITDGNGYKDLAKTFKAENWNPAYWAELFARSGAKYAGICAVHHDGYCMWDSEVTDFCAGKLGPKRDLYGDLIKEIREKGLKTIASFHHGRTHKHFNSIINQLKKNPEYTNVDLLNPEFDHYYWFTGSKERFTKNRLDLTLEFIDKYAPDVLWFDGGGGGFNTEKILAKHFNTGIKNQKEVCVHNKGNFGTNFGVYSYENGAHRPSYVDWPWEDDTPSAVGWCDWMWDKNIQYKKARDVIVRLADLVARNGGLLLSINPKSDGTLDQGQIDLLLGVGDWLGKYGEAIYGTRPWKIIGEGHLENLFYTETNSINGEESRAIQPNTSLFNEEDVRFTTKDNFLYAIVLGTPSNKNYLIKSLHDGEKITMKNRITGINLLGFGKVDFKRNDEGLLIKLPKALPDSNAIVFKISVEGKIESRQNEGRNTIVPMKT